MVSSSASERDGSFVNANAKSKTKDLFTVFSDKQSLPLELIVNKRKSSAVTELDKQTCLNLNVSKSAGNIYIQIMPITTFLYLIENCISISMLGKQQCPSEDRR